MDEEFYRIMFRLLVIVCVMLAFRFVFIFILGI